MQIPAALKDALEQVAARFKLGELERAYARISENYRAGSPLGRLTEIERVAYAVARMPATYSACSAVLSEVGERLPPDARLTSLLDLGAGLGSALWAATGAISSLDRATLIDADAGMIHLGRMLASSSGAPAVGQQQWLTADINATSPEPHDLVVCSYSLGELTDQQATRVLDSAWRATRHVLVLIEPGTTAGFARVRQWRTHLIALGAHIVAPCPHADPCPLPENDWCHFAQRVERTSLHRRLKAGTLGHEDEKFSYVAFSRSAARLSAARIIRHPQVTSGAIKLELCTPDGLRQRVVTRKVREEFRQARHARWGGEWPD